MKVPTPEEMAERAAWLRLVKAERAHHDQTDLLGERDDDMKGAFAEVLAARQALRDLGVDVDAGDGTQAHEVRGAPRDASEALTAAGIPDDGTGLAARIRLLAEDRDAEKAMKEQLLDPEFNFTGDGMGVMDHRGLIQAMVLGFDEAFQAAPATAQNFITYTFNDRETRRPAYVVTIQRATGKSPAEKYIEVATELRELKAATCPACKAARDEKFYALYDSISVSMGHLDPYRDALDMSKNIRCSEHAAPIEPLPEEPEAERQVPDEHVRLDMRRGCLFCERCGKEQGFTQPIAGADLKALLDSFGTRHRLCPPRT